MSELSLFESTVIISFMQFCKDILGAVVKQQSLPFWLLVFDMASISMINFVLACFTPDLYIMY